MAAMSSPPVTLFPDGRNDRRILVTGGAGCVGSNLACGFRWLDPTLPVVALDNLRRRGSELNLPRLRDAGITFVHGDVRDPDDLARAGPARAIVECSAEPSVLAGYGEGRDYMVQTNLLGTARCLEAAVRHHADLIFLSTSRVYPVDPLNALPFVEEETRYRLAPDGSTPGASPAGIDVDFPLEGSRSLYGATKLCSELLITEYAAAQGLRAVINRCGVIAGPWQFGRVDQGVAAWWVMRHMLGGELRYIGWGGRGKQVRDLLHVDDLFDLVVTELARIDTTAGRTFNVGGGPGNALSLLEMTALCRELTGNSPPIGREEETRPGDVRIYITDNARVGRALGWAPRRPLRRIFEDLRTWIGEQREVLRRVAG
jgi:CDP-paratose 2-epimerase